ncbi:MAG: class I SAM-dependent methyltransferase family protein [Archaeoglobales archaeon]|nr:MAG: class I SAM-dependent methyltransferase family protein [Archaeoglobales archaeon]
MSLKKMLKGKVSDEELSKVRRSFEIIGDVVVVDIPDEILHLKGMIIDAILKKHKHVKTILRKTGEVGGTYRVARYEVIYGSETETIAKEHGCRFLLDPTKVYYSVKLSGERERIMKLVKPGERVLVMFAGVGPFAIVIAKHAKPSEVVGVELNPIAVEYFKKNVELNKVKNVKVYAGDVREVVPKLEGEFDRILMPSPYNAESFVDIAAIKIKEGGYVHYYTFAGVEEEEELPRRVEELFKSYGVECKAEFMRECGNFAPYVNRYVIDLKVIKKS